MRTIVAICILFLLVGCGAPQTASLAPSALPSAAAQATAAPLPTRAPPAMPTVIAPEASDRQLSSDIVITYERSGGIAGIADSYVIRSDGAVVLESSRLAPSGTHNVYPVNGGAQALQTLLDAITATGIRSARVAGSQQAACCDQMYYEVTVVYGDGTLTLDSDDAASGDALQAVFTLVQNYIVAARQSDGA